MWWIIVFASLACMVMNVWKGETFAKDGNMAGVIWSIAFVIVGALAIGVAVEKIGY